LGQREVAIPVTLGRYQMILSPLSGLATPKAVEFWGSLLSTLKALHRDLGGQVGAFTAPIVGHWVLDSVHDSVGT